MLYRILDCGLRNGPAFQSAERGGDLPWLQIAELRQTLIDLFQIKFLRVNLLAQPFHILLMFWVIFVG
jgi:hypothetical protein